MTYGTSYFKNLSAAVRYYRPYGYDKLDVQRKIREGEIHLGKPPLKPGATLRLIDGGTRYEIQENPGRRKMQRRGIAKDAPQYRYRMDSSNRRQYGKYVKKDGQLAHKRSSAMKQNPPRVKGRKTKGGGRSVTLKNFTGTITKKGGQVIIRGRRRK